MIRWMFSSMTQHPALKSISTVTPAQRDIYNRDMATVIQRMMFSDCRKEAVAGLKYEGMPALAAGFQLLGQVAARDIFGSPQVAQGLAALGTAFDKTKISALYKEAGVPEQQIPATQSGK